jgi:hypothetical protein
MAASFKLIACVLLCVMPWQVMLKGNPKVMDPQRAEVQECFLRSGADTDAWKYDWRVGGCSCTSRQACTWLGLKCPVGGWEALCWPAEQQPGVVMQTQQATAEHCSL